MLDPQNKRPFEEVIAETLTASSTTTSASSTTQSVPSGAVVTNRSIVAREAIMFQRRRQSTFGESLFGNSPAGKKGQITLPSQANKLDSYFKKSFKPPSSTGSQPSSTNTTPARTSSKSEENQEDLVEEDEDIDLSNITRDSDDDSAPVYDGTHRTNRFFLLLYFPLTLDRIFCYTINRNLRKFEIYVFGWIQGVAAPGQFSLQLDIDSQSVSGSTETRID